MPAYKLYCLDGEMQIVTSKSLAAEDDKQALQFAMRIANQGISAELWARERLVGQFLIRTRRASGPRVGL